ncbi:putative crocetin glucosyltransferase [Helianthus debilis subsp. tardiflorus]
MKDHVDVLKISPKILVNTFDKLEVEPIIAIEKLVMLPVGHLIPSEFLDGNGLSYNSFTDLFEKTVEDYIKWLNLKPKYLVMYVSFGSMETLSIDQVEDMAYMLV